MREHNFISETITSLRGVMEINFHARPELHWEREYSELKIDSIRVHFFKH